MCEKRGDHDWKDKVEKSRLQTENSTTGDALDFTLWAYNDPFCFE